jgi:hypothetical protein
VTQSHVPPAVLPGAAAESSPWTGSRIAAVVIGSLLVLLSLVLLGAGGTALWADRTQREGGYATSDVHTFSSEGSALATESTDLGSAGVGWLYSPGVLGKVRIRVTPTSTSSPLFVGIGHTSDVDRYLGGVQHTVITDFWTEKVDTIAGSASVSRPGRQSFWAASDTGVGARTLTWDPKDGSWTVVVMNADGRPGVAVGADLGAKVPALPWIGLGFLAAGAIFLAGGALLVVGAFRRRSHV